MSAPLRGARTVKMRTAPTTSRKNNGNAQRVTAFKETMSVAAHVAQILLVGIAVFGYFYTVMPIYRKELLADRMARQQEKVTELEKQSSLVTGRMQENTALLTEQSATIAKNKDHIAALQSEIQSLSLENTRLFEENAAALLQKKQTDIELASALEETASTRKNLLDLETELERQYRAIFRDSMERYAVEQFFALYKNKKTTRDSKYYIDLIVEYKDKTIPISALIEKSLKGYNQKLSKSYAMIPATVRKRLAEEIKNDLANREDLKTVPYVTEKVITLINERDNRLFALADDLPQAERTKEITRISQEYNRRATDLIAEFKHDYIKHIREFFES